jgi:YbbR domain-containing protein
MARRRIRNLRYGLLALVISTVLWGMAHGSSSVERGYDVPIAFDELADDLVITAQSVDEINVRVLGSRASLRNLSPTKLEYAINVSGVKPGVAEYEVDVSRLVMPRGARIVSRSPARVNVKFERRGRKSVRIRPDLEGQPAEGFVMGAVEVDPSRVWLVGARSEVLRLSEVVTETIDVSGVEAPVEREVRLSLGNGHVWLEENQPVTVRIPIDAVQLPEVPVEDGDEPASPGSESTG